MERETCQDSIGFPITSATFDVQHWKRGGLQTLSGSYVHGIYGVVTADNYIPYTPRASIIAGDSLISLKGGPSDLIARTNPSRPVVTPLTLLQDVVDIPKQLRDIGRVMRKPRNLLSPKEAANQFLGLKFGWLPLIDDAKKLIELQSYIHKRAGEIQRLYSKGGLKRTLQLDKTVGMQERSIVLDGSPGMGVSTTESTIVVGKLWGSVRWKPTVLPPYNPSDAQRIQMARQVVSGFSVEGMAQGAWDLLPWSWMVDWFYDVGSFLLQNSNTIPAVPTDVCLMTNIVSNTEWATVQTQLGPWKGSVSYERKTRAVGTGSVTAQMPHLDLSRLSVLTALAVQRFQR